jgi:hypothetical protein
VCWVWLDSLIGVSPEFEMALYTMCFLNGKEDNIVQLGPYRANIKCYPFGRGQNVKIGSAFPDTAPLTEEQAAVKIQAHARGVIARHQQRHQQHHQQQQQQSHYHHQHHQQQHHHHQQRQQQPAPAMDAQNWPRPGEEAAPAVPAAPSSTENAWSKPHKW